jgi:hypothetical protein
MESPYVAQASLNFLASLEEWLKLPSKHELLSSDLVLLPSPQPKQEKAYEIYPAPAFKWSSHLNLPCAGTTGQLCDLVLFLVIHKAGFSSNYIHCSLQINILVFLKLSITSHLFIFFHKNLR